MKLVSLRVQLPAKWWAGGPDAGEKGHCEPIKDAGSRCAHNIHRSCTGMRWVGVADEHGTVRCGSDKLGAENVCPLRRVLVESGCHLDSSTTLAGGNVQWSIIVPSDGALKAFAEGLKRRGAGVIVERTTVLRTKEEITVEEERVLLSALEHGYFDTPRGVDLEGLSQTLGIEKGRLRLVLGRAHRKLVASRCHD